MMTNVVNFCYLLLILSVCRHVRIGGSSSLDGDYSLAKNAWDLPLVPHASKLQELEKTFISTLPPYHSKFDQSYKKKIPRSVWIAFAEKPTNETMKPHIQQMMTRNAQKNWTFHLQGNDEKLAFMETFYANTSTLWAYKAIHPRVGNSAADIWRYAVLWMFGGLYLDDDSYLEATYDEVFNSNETFVVSTEKNLYKNHCYHPKYHLADAAMTNRYPNSSMSVENIYEGRVIVTWAIFSAPRHPIVYRTLSNIVELIRSEYLKQSALSLPRRFAKWLICMCTTGPSLFTASGREMILHYGPELMMEGMTVHKRDFYQFGGVFKMFAPNHSDHYMHTMQMFDISLLHSYINSTNNDIIQEDKNNQPNTKNVTTDLLFSPAQDINNRWNGKLISSDGKVVFYVMDNARYGFVDRNAFIALHMQHHRVYRVTQGELLRIPIGNGTTIQSQKKIKGRVEGSLLSSNDRELVRDYQMKLKMDIHNKTSITVVKKLPVSEQPIPKWSDSWPSLKNTYLAHLEGKVKTFNVSTV